MEQKKYSNEEFMNSEYLTSKDSDLKTAPRFDLVVIFNYYMYVLASILSKNEKIQYSTLSY